MLNEAKEAERYLRGENIVLENLYRICYLILKTYKQRGMDKLGAREALFGWANSNDIFIPYYVNSTISYIWDFDKRALSTVDTVRVSEQDIYEINRRFDKKKTKLIAFALLCYGKVYADNKNEFSLSFAELGTWIGMKDSSVRKTYIPELTGFSYISTVSSKTPFHHHGKALHQRTRFKLLVPCVNEGAYEVTDDIVGEFERLFR